MVPGATYGALWAAANPEAGRDGGTDCGTRWGAVMNASVRHSASPSNPRHLERLSAARRAPPPIERHTRIGHGQAGELLIGGVAYVPRLAIRNDSGGRGKRSDVGHYLDGPDNTRRSEPYG